MVEKNGLSILSVRDKWGYTPAHWAALDGNLEVCRFIIDKNNFSNVNNPSLMV